MNMDLPPFLTQHEYGEIRLTGHRIGLLHVVDCYNEGMTPQQIAEHFPTLPLLLVQDVVGFYLKHRAEADAYVAACRAEIDRQAAASHPWPDLAELRRRMQAKRRAEAK
jgi:uncharacterized protein (DUF433 family)